MVEQVINTALKVAAAVRTGTMGVNNYFGGDITVPFGGFKESGIAVKNRCMPWMFILS